MWKNGIIGWAVVNENDSHSRGIPPGVYVKREFLKRKFVIEYTDGRGCWGVLKRGFAPRQIFQKIHNATNMC